MGAQFSAHASWGIIRWAQVRRHQTGLNRTHVLHLRRRRRCQHEERRVWELLLEHVKLRSARRAHGQQVSAGGARQRLRGAGL